MANNSGLFLALEGPDGSGKATQLELLTKRLTDQGHQVYTVRFPRYEEESSYFARRYLEGAYGAQHEVGPYTSSLFFALDRFEAAKSIRQALDEGKIVIADRFTGSNMASQGAKIAEPEQRRGYFLWLDNLEFEMLKIPRPDKSLVLRVTAELSMDRLAHRQAKDNQTKVDIHETDPAYIAASVQAYDDLCQLFPKDFKEIDCVRDGKLLDIEHINRLIWQNIEPDLPSLTQAVPDRPYYTPPELNNKTAALYQRTMDILLATHADIKAKLGEYDQNVAERVADSMLPLAASGSMTINGHGFKPSISKKLVNLAGKFLRSNYDGAAEPLKLIQVKPRNELDLISSILYPYAQSSSDKLEAALSKMSYVKKESVLKTYLAAKDQIESSSSVLQDVEYSWDILSSYQDMLSLLKQQEGRDFQPQLISPRHGYEVPSVIEEAGLTDQYLACFDASLELYSTLQVAHGDEIAQFATLQGHRLRWRITYNALEMADLLNTKDLVLDSEASRNLFKLFQEKLTEVHPLLAESLDFSPHKV